MIKTIKVKKQMRLDGLIKYGFDGGLKREKFSSSGGGDVRFNKHGFFELDETYYIRPDSIFTVEVEEEINNTTIFKSVVGVLNDDRIMLTNTYTTIEDIQDKYGSMKEIQAVIDGKLQLIWEAE